MALIVFKKNDIICCISSFYNLESNPNCGRLDFVRCAVFSKGFWDGCVDTARGKQVHDGIVEGWKTWSTHCWFLSDQWSMVDGGVVEIWLKGKEYYLLYNIGKYVKLWERDKFGLMRGKP